VLVDGPRKLVVQLPSLKCKQKGRKGHQTRQGNQQRADLWPKRGQHEVLAPQALCGVLDLVKLDGGIDEDAEVVDDETDDLNRVLEAQGVPYEPEFVQIAEHEYGEVGGDGARLVLVGVLGLRMDRVLIPCEDIAARARSALRGGQARATVRTIQGQWR
jgi:hypothetical protein